MKWKTIGDLLEIVVGMANFRKFAIYPPQQKHIRSRKSVGILLKLT